VQNLADRIVGMTSTPLDGRPDLIFSAVPKRILIDVPIPRGYLGNVSVILRNDDYDQGPHLASLCSLRVMKSGGNLPCLQIPKDVDEGFGESKRLDGYNGQTSRAKTNFLFSLLLFPAAAKLSLEACSSTYPMCATPKEATWRKNLL